MITRKGNECFDAITGKKVPCIQTPRNQNLSPIPPRGTPPPPVIIPGGGGGGSGCCQPFGCPVTCLDITNFKACLSNFEVIPYVPYGDPINVPSIATIVGTLSASCQAIYAKLIANFTTVTGGAAFVMTGVSSQEIQTQTFSGSTTGCADVTLSIMWGYLDVSPKAKAQIIRVKFCSTAPIDVPSFNLCIDCNTLPPAPCVPITNISITPLNWKDSVNNWHLFTDVGIWELNTYVVVGFVVNITGIVCDLSKIVTIGAGTNCGNAVVMPFPYIYSPPSINLLLSASIKWDTSCPAIPCPGPYPNNMFEFSVTTPENPTPTPFMVNVPLDQC